MQKLSHMLNHYREKSLLTAFFNVKNHENCKKLTFCNFSHFCQNRKIKSQSTFLKNHDFLRKIAIVHFLPPLHFLTLAKTFYRTWLVMVLVCFECLFYIQPSDSRSRHVMDAIIMTSIEHKEKSF